MEENNLAKQLIPIIVSKKMFRYNIGYICPYCGLTGKNNVPLTAIEVAEHIVKEHKEKFLDLLLGEH